MIKYLDFFVLHILLLFSLLYFFFCITYFFIILYKFSLLYFFFVLHINKNKVRLHFCITYYYILIKIKLAITYCNKNNDGNNLKFRIVKISNYSKSEMLN